MAMNMVQQPADQGDAVGLMQLLLNMPIELTESRRLL